MCWSSKLKPEVSKDVPESSHIRSFTILSDLSAAGPQCPSLSCGGLEVLDLGLFQLLRAMFESTFVVIVDARLITRWMRPANVLVVKGETRGEQRRTEEQPHQVFFILSDLSATDFVHKVPAFVVVDDTEAELDHKVDAPS